MAQKKRQEMQKNLPTLGCDLCRDNHPLLGGGWIMEVVNGGRIVRACECRRARERAKRGVANQPVHDGKAAGAGR
jgi:hypothetical protein